MTPKNSYESQKIKGKIGEIGKDCEERLGKDCEERLGENGGRLGKDCG